jgi:hypothetical protein
MHKRAATEFVHVLKHKPRKLWSTKTGKKYKINMHTHEQQVIHLATNLPIFKIKKIRNIPPSAPRLAYVLT